MTRATTRRAVLVGACATCAAGALVACGDGSATPSAPTTAAAPGTALGSTADVPVGGGTVFPEAGVVVVQPSAGTFAAYSARCTHAGCTVRDVAGGTINCPCHGSRFAIADGAPLNGPATRPLVAAKVTVTGTSITLA
jgi:Rieske Fe-S protein